MSQVVLKHGVIMAGNANGAAISLDLNLFIRCYVLNPARLHIGANQMTNYKIKFNDRDNNEERVVYTNSLQCVMMYNRLYPHLELIGLAKTVHKEGGIK